MAITLPDGIVIPNSSVFSEVGVGGLKKVNGRILEEIQAAFRYPGLLRTISEIRNNPTVGAAMNVYRMLMSRITWSVTPPKGATKKEMARARIVESMMGDMEHSWGAFIHSVIPFIEYGYSLNEIVLRRRLLKDGSAFNDGVVGIRKLAPRHPSTVFRWVFAENGQDILAIEQTTASCDPQTQARLHKLHPSGRVVVPMEKLLHVVSNPVNGNPEGKSIYANIFLAYKQLELLQDQQLIGVAKDVQGMLKIELPPKYFSAEASAAEKATLKEFQGIIDNYNAGQQRGLLVPAAADPDTKLPIFSYSLMERKGTPAFDVEKAMRRLQSDILSALSVDILKLGSEGSGSFSLAESKSSVLAMAIDARMREIKDALNSKLIPCIYKANGWDLSRPVQFEYGDVDEISLEEYSKAVQRIFSTSAIEVDRDVMNAIRRAMRVPILPDDAPVDAEKLPGNMAKQSSRSGDGMEIGTTGDGTSKTPASTDRSTGNKGK